MNYFLWPRVTLKIMAETLRAWEQRKFSNFSN